MKTSHYAGSNDFSSRPAVLGSGIANLSATTNNHSQIPSASFDATIPFRPHNQQQSNIYDLNYQSGAPNFQPKHLQSTSSQTSSVTHQDTATSASNTTYGSSKSRDSGASSAVDKFENEHSRPALDGPDVSDYQVIKSTTGHKFQQQEHQHNKKRKRETGWFIIYSHSFCCLFGSCLNSLQLASKQFSRKWNN